MTPKERVKAALTFQTVDRVPSTIFDNGVWLTGRRGMSLQDLLDLDDGGASILLDVYRETGTDIAWVGNGLHGYCMHALGAHTNYSGVGVSGEISPLLKDISEIHNFDPAQIRAKLEADSGIQKLLKQTRIVKEAVGDQMYVATVLGAPFTYAGSMVGVQNYMLLLFDEDDDIEPLNEYAIALSIEYAKLFIEAGVDIICLGDPVASGDLISQKMFEQWALPMEKAAFDALDGAEFRMLHICGNTLVRLESLKKLPIQGFSLDSVDLKTAMEIAYGSYAIFGNASPFAIVQSKTPEEISEYAKGLCAIAGKKGGFVLMPGCDTTPGTPLENLVALLKAPRAED